MAVSGSQNFTQNAAEVVDDALILLGVAHPEETVSTSTQNYALDALNKMIKAWVGQGVNLWALDQGALLFDNDVVKYTFHNKVGTGGKVAAGIIASGLVQTTFSADEAAAQTVLSVTSSTGMAASDKIVIELDSGARHESTIASVDSATQITIDDALASAASSGNYIYTYTLTTDEIKHPEQIRNVRLRNEGGNEIPMRQLSRQEYMELSDKNTEGSPYTWYFDKQLDNPALYVYTEPDNLKESLRFDYVKTLDDLDATTDNFKFPDEWLEAITYNLALRLAPAFGKESKIQIVAPLAAQFLDDTKRADSEEASTQFRPGVC
jgi:hypothetical protein